MRRRAVAEHRAADVELLLAAPRPDARRRALLGVDAVGIDVVERELEMADAQAGTLARGYALRVNVLERGPR